MFNLVVNSYLINLHRYRITTIDNFSQGTYLSQQQQYLHGLLISRQVCIGPGKKKTERGITRAKLLFVNKPITNRHTIKYSTNFIKLTPLLKKEEHLLTLSLLNFNAGIVNSAVGRSERGTCILIVQLPMSEVSKLTLYSR